MNAFHRATTFLTIALLAGCGSDPASGDVIQYVSDTGKAGDSGETGDDAASPTTDSDTPVTDSGSPVTDSGGPVTDSGSPVTDSGSPVGDTGVPTGDAGAPSAPAASDPVTSALTAVAGSKTYDVGPGKPYTPDTMPWKSLATGDVVNVYPNTANAEYAFKFCVGAAGTASKPVIINGVTDSTGTRPKFNFKNAKTSAGCNGFFTSSTYSLETYGGVVVSAPLNAASPKPSFITIQNLDLYGAADGNTFTKVGGGTGSYASSAAVWIQVGTDVTLANDLLHDSAYGVFTMTKNSDPTYMCERIKLRSNRIWGNGVVGSYLEHNVYMQSTSPVIEGNYLGQLRTGALGSTYKSRSSGEIFRYNYAVASARAIDWVHSEDSNPGVASQADYGTDYAYGNVIVVDPWLPYGSDLGNPIHYGGDNCGEQSRDLDPKITSANIDAALTSACGGGSKIVYRKHLYFYNNTVLHHGTSNYPVFELSLDGIQVDAWNNIFAFSGGSQHAFLDSVGQLALRGNNLTFGTVGGSFDPVSHVALPAMTGAYYDVATFGTVSSGDPLFANVAKGDVTLGAGSPAIGKGTGLPAGAQAATSNGGSSSAVIGGTQLPFAPTASYMQLPITMQPVVTAAGGSNGLVARANANDLGALAK